MVASRGRSTSTRYHTGMVMNETTTSAQKPQPWRLVYRLPLLLLHLLLLPPALLVYLPALRRQSTQRMEEGDDHIGWRPSGWTQTLHQWWTRRLLKVLGLHLSLQGRLPSGAVLVAANHISWLDIIALHALKPMWLVSKAEVRRWPLIGRLAEAVGTLFIQRGDSHSRIKVARRMAALLRQGHTVGFFPEAGIMGGVGVGRFHARLFGPAIRAAVPVVPVTIRYHERGRQPRQDLHAQIVFGPGSHFFGNLLRVMMRPAMEVELIICSALSPPHAGRDTLSAQARELVRLAYER